GSAKGVGALSGFVTHFAEPQGVPPEARVFRADQVDSGGVAGVSGAGAGSGAGGVTFGATGAGAWPRFWTLVSPAFSSSRNAVWPASPRRRCIRLTTRV